MIIEALLALSLSQAPNFYAPPVLAKSFSSSRSSFSSPSRSYSSPSRSFSSSYSPSRSSAPVRSPSRSFSSPSRPASSSSVLRSAPKTPTAVSAPSVQRISKQTTVVPSVAPAAPRIAPPVVSVPRSQAPRTVTRETYVERYHDGGITSNPFFWMWALDGNRNNSQPQQPTQVLVQNTDGEQVKVPASQLVVKKDAWNPVREFFVFLLGGGAGVVSFIFFARPILGRR